MSEITKKTSVISTRNIQVVSVKETKEERAKDYKFMENLSMELSSMGNLLIRHTVNNLYRVDEMCKNTPNLTKSEAIKILQEESGTSLRNTGYRLLQQYDHIPSDIKTNMNGEIFKKLDKQFYKLKRNEVSIPSFKANSVPIRVSERIYKEGDDFFIRFPLSQKQKKGGQENIVFKLFFGRDKSGNEIIVNRILDGTYKMMNSFFKFNKYKLFFHVVFEEPVVPIKGLDDNRIMGIDLGISRLVSHYITNIKHQPYQLDYLGEFITNDMVKIHNERKTIQTALKVARGGHGRKRKLERLNSLSDKQHNKNKTNINAVALSVVRVAELNKCGIIKMEDLSGIKNDEKKHQFLKNWSYAMLQDNIARCAEKRGITTLWVVARDTSVTCPYCGLVNKENRLSNREEYKNKKGYAKQFECLNPSCPEFGVNMDADIIASINIAKKEAFPVKPSSVEFRRRNSKKNKNNGENEKK